MLIRDCIERGQLVADEPARVSTSSRNSGARRLKSGLYAYYCGDYKAALREFEQACDAASATSDHKGFVETCTYILRILAEREEFSKIDRIEERVIRIVTLADLPPSLQSRAFYVLGICNCYQDSRHELAMNRFRQAIDWAIRSEDKEALASPLYGAATVLYARKRYDEALHELERLDILLSCLHLPDLVSASHLLRAMVYRNMGRIDEALKAAWASFESLKHHPHLVLYLHTLCVLGTIFQSKGDSTAARLYLDLAERSLKRDELPRIARLVDEAWVSLGAIRQTDFDIMFDTRTGVLVEKSVGEIRFEGQFILRDLLRIFLENPGRIFTKEDLVKAIWKENYNPEIHDNKIYVTIKRLRKLLTSEGGGSDYILRAKTGYFLNPKIRILINDRPVSPENNSNSQHLPLEKQ